MLRTCTKIFIVGPQGSGKGTQSHLLADYLKIPTFSMGQLLRDEVAAKSEIGKRIAKTLEEGKIVPEEVSGDILKERIRRPDVVCGYILDGYPRNMRQYESFVFEDPTHMIVLEVPRDVSIARLSGRLTCLSCGNSVSEGKKFHEGSACTCGGVYGRRTDDTPESIARRLDIYEKETSEVIALYEKRGLVRRINGVGTIQQIHKRILKALGV